MISSILADMLQVSRGDAIEVEVLEGRRGTFEVPVAGIFETYIGSPAYIEIGALARLLKERPSVTNVHLRRAANASLRYVPRVSGPTTDASGSGSTTEPSGC